MIMYTYYTTGFDYLVLNGFVNGPLIQSLTSGPTIDSLSDVNFVGFGQLYSNVTHSLSNSYVNNGIYNSFWIFTYALNNANIT